MVVGRGSADNGLADEQRYLQGEDVPIREGCSDSNPQLNRAGGAEEQGKEYMLSLETY